MKMKSWPLDQPALNGRRLMSAIVVEDEMNIQCGWHFGINLVEELTELKRTVPTMKLTDDFASLGVEGSKQRGRAIARVIMSPAFGLTGAHGQNRLRAIQRLNLRFLVHTQNQSFIRRIKVKPHHIADLLDKQGILRKFKSLAAVWSQSKSAPHAMDAGVTYATSFGQRACAPVRRVLRCGFQGHRQYSFDFGVTESARRTRSRFIQQPVKSFMQNASAPLASGLFDYSQARRHLRIGAAAGRGQNDPCSLCQCLVRFRSPRPTLQRFALFRAQCQFWYRSSFSHQLLLYN